MRTTLIISDPVMLKVRKAALKQHKTLSDIVEFALRRMFEPGKPAPEKLPKIPTFRGGDLKVDISNREALYQTMEER